MFTSPQELSRPQTPRADFSRLHYRLRRHTSTLTCAHLAATLTCCTPISSSRSFPVRPSLLFSFLSHPTSTPTCPAGFHSTVLAPPVASAQKAPSLLNDTVLVTDFPVTDRRTSLLELLPSFPGPRFSSFIHQTFIQIQSHTNSRALTNITSLKFCNNPVRQIPLLAPPFYR